MTRATLICDKTQCHDIDESKSDTGFRRIEGAKMRRIVITGPQPVDMLDLLDPLEVFKFAPEYEVVVASPEGTTELQLNHGFKISDTVPFTNLAGQIDTLVVAGGPGANDELYDDEYLHRIIGLASRSRRVAAICTG